MLHPAVHVQRQEAMLSPASGGVANDASPQRLKAVPTLAPHEVALVALSEEVHCATEVGASFTGVTVMVMVPVVGKPVVSVAVTVKLAVPLKLSAGSYVQVAAEQVSSPKAFVCVAGVIVKASPSGSVAGEKPTRLVSSEVVNGVAMTTGGTLNSLESVEFGPEKLV